MPNLQVERSTLSLSRYISIRHFGPYDNANATWSKLTQIALRLGVGGPETVAFGICYDDPATTPPAQLRYDACLALGEAQASLVRDSISRGAANSEPSLSGLRMEDVQLRPTQMVVHKGSYQDLRKAYAGIADYAQQNRINSVRPPFIEVYRNNPVLSSPTELFTEIHFGHT